MWSLMGQWTMCKQRRYAQERKKALYFSNFNDSFLLFEQGVRIFILHWAGQANYTAGPDDS